MTDSLLHFNVARISIRDILRTEVRVTKTISIRDILRTEVRVTKSISIREICGLKFVLRLRGTQLSDAFTFNASALSQYN